MTTKRCTHRSACGAVSWDYPMMTIGGVDYQVSAWCPDCGALAVWTPFGNRRKWIRPKGAGK